MRESSMNTVFARHAQGRIALRARRGPGGGTPELMASQRGVHATETPQVTDKETGVLLGLTREVLAGGVSGDIVEMGCYRGDTSLLLQRVLEKEFPGATTRLWLYDSFSGLPARTAEDASVAGDRFSEGELFVTKKEVVLRFKKAGLRVPRIRKGFFEELSDTDLPGAIAFAFLDGDLYQSIATSLKLVWPRLSEGAIVAVHDYNNPQLPGAARAVDEWLSVHPGVKLERRESLAILKP